MKRLAAAALGLLLMTGCAATDPTAMVSQLTGNPLVSSLTSGLGFNPTQAVGGAGALLGMAQQNLAKADWTKIADAIPGTKDLINTSKSLGAISGDFGNLAGSADAFTKMGLNADQVSKLTPAMTDYVSKAAGPDVGNLFKGAIK